MLAGCGGEAEQPPAPKLPAALAGTLAHDADLVAERLAAGDACGAAEQARALQGRAIEALNRPGHVPAALKEDLGLAVADLVDRTTSECVAAQPPPPPPTVTQDEQAEEEDNEEGEGRGRKGKGKAKGHDKKDDG